MASRRSTLLPYGWIATSVKNCQYDDTLGLGAEEYGIREAAYSKASRISVHNRKTLWITRGHDDSTVDLTCKFGTKSKTAFFVPQSGYVELTACSAPKDDCQSHLLRRSVIDAFTSSQGTTSAGFAS